MLGLHLLLWLTSLFFPVPQGPIFGPTSGGGGSITFGTSIGCQTGLTTTTVSTNGSGCVTNPTLNLPSGALAWDACFFQSTTSGQTITTSDTAGNMPTGNTLQFNSAAGSFQMFYFKNTTANASDAFTCTLSSTTGGGTNSGVVAGYITGANTSTPADVTNAGNANDGGSSGTAIASASFSTTNAAEFVVQCAGVSVQFTAPSAGTIGGLTATLTAHSGTAASQNPFEYCQYVITSSTLASQTGDITATSSTRWNTAINSFKP